MFKLFLLITLLVLLRFYISYNYRENFDEIKILTDLEDIKKNCLVKGEISETTLAQLKGAKGDMGGVSMAYVPLVNGADNTQYFYYQGNDGPNKDYTIIKKIKPQFFNPSYMWAFTDENKIKCQSDNDLDLIFNKEKSEIILAKNPTNPLIFERTNNTYKDKESGLCLTNDGTKMILTECSNTKPYLPTQQWYFQF